MSDDGWFWLTVIVGIVFGAAVSLFGIWTNHRRKELLLKQAHDERMSALEKGVPLPEIPASMLGEGDSPSAARWMRHGIALTLIGIVLYLALERLVGEELSLFGLIPAAVGVANLLYAAVLWRRQQAAPPNP